MMFGGRHNRQCETAKLHVCRCTACGGALHGWVGSIAMARPELAEHRRERRDQVKARWDQVVQTTRKAIQQAHARSKHRLRPARPRRLASQTLAKRVQTPRSRHCPGGR